MNHSTRPWLALGASILTILISLGASAHDATPFPGTHVIKTGHSYQAMVKKLPEAVAKNKMGVVAKASATLGARKIGVTIPGNMVVMVFHPKFAVRMLDASVPPASRRRCAFTSRRMRTVRRRSPIVTRAASSRLTVARSSTRWRKSSTPYSPASRPTRHPEDGLTHVGAKSQKRGQEWRGQTSRCKAWPR